MTTIEQYCNVLGISESDHLRWPELFDEVAYDSFCYMSQSGSNPRNWFIRRMMIQRTYDSSIIWFIDLIIDESYDSSIRETSSLHHFYYLITTCVVWEAETRRRVVHMSSSKRNKVKRNRSEPRRKTGLLDLPNEVLDMVAQYTTATEQQLQDWRARRDSLKRCPVIRDEEFERWAALRSLSATCSRLYDVCARQVTFVLQICCCTRYKSFEYLLNLPDVRTRISAVSMAHWSFSRACKATHPVRSFFTERQIEQAIGRHLWLALYLQTVFSRTSSFRGRSFRER